MTPAPAWTLGSELEPKFVTEGIGTVRRPMKCQSIQGSMDLMSPSLATKQERAEGNLMHLVSAPCAKWKDRKLLHSVSGALKEYLLKTWIHSKKGSVFSWAWSLGGDGITSKFEGLDHPPQKRVTEINLFLFPRRDPNPCKFEYPPHQELLSLYGNSRRKTFHLSWRTHEEEIVLFLVSNGKSFILVSALNPSYLIYAQM